MRRLMVLGCLLLTASCTTFRDDLVRGQKAYETSSHERALAILKQLEPDQDHLSAEERAHYAYLRGMTDYRIGYRAEARHWLAIADQADKATPGALPTEWKTRMNEALEELNAQVYSQGMSELVNSERPLEKPPVKKSVDEP